MASMTNLKRQHVEIINTIKIIDKLMKNNDFEKDSNDIAKSISILAGKLKIHLDTEDKFLYPKLAKHDNISVRNKANKYIDEMGSICEVFTDYKNKFNTKSKIMNSLDEFKKESKYIFDTIKKRISKEDIDLYPLL
ncbi:hemerythrin domain-containing protein [Tepidibacter hydrothermalis]|uniref:Hemerythrin domain-containing protein n=1 Tax=Tepidibacter hydrothermalis TaxID=3036126 RepID=A0ABY8EI98_9FIRM|nr:hemerythrin domain-containing protein [Tepidibacter hydrothermalis]WFD11337.1 hemerythrin domain-containing protein [Tepidibacter hydrothermalis]